MTWRDGPMLAFDLETTGVDTTTARIVTATVLLIDGPHIQAHNWLLNPGVPIPAEATAVHGITDKVAAEQGTDPTVGVAEIAETIGKHWSPTLPLVAFNASYDLSLLDAELLRHCGERLTISGPVLDPYVIDKAVDPYRKGKRRLSDQCLHYGVQLDHAHTSSDDALAAARLAWKLAQRFSGIGDLDLATLHARQADWHARQATSLEAYLRREKRRAGATPTEIAAVVCDRGWPTRSTP